MPSTAKRPRQVGRPEWQIWRRHVVNVRKLIRKLKREVSPHGEKWTRKMVAHWERRLDELLKQEPKRWPDK